METLTELQLDGLPGPLYFHGGLSPGNIASQTHAGMRSQPRLAARQCLAKMRTVLGLGVPVALLPPLARPDIGHVRKLGFSGTDGDVLSAVARQDPLALRQACSNAFAWTANCATVIPATDSEDGYTHFIPANLAAMPHRALEASARTAMLRRIFSDGERFCVHDAVPALTDLGDEGAANHHRAAGPDGAVHLFVHGRSREILPEQLPRKHPARQWLGASAAAARLGRARQVVHARQHPAAIDAGAFHNDVVMVGSPSRILVHEQAWVDLSAVLDAVQRATGGVTVWVVPAARVPLAEAVRSYLFNSLLIDTPTGTVLVAPGEAAEGAAAAEIAQMLAEHFVSRVVHVAVRESMHGGGGPACLRLRVPLDAAGLAAVHRGVLLDEAKLQRLEAWVDRRYRTHLDLDDLRDPDLLEEGRTALDELTTILALPRLYDFQGAAV